TPSGGGNAPNVLPAATPETSAPAPSTPAPPTPADAGTSAAVVSDEAAPPPFATTTVSEDTLPAIPPAPNVVTAMPPAVLKAPAAASLSRTPQPRPWTTPLRQAVIALWQLHDDANAGTAWWS